MNRMRKLARWVWKAAPISWRISPIGRFLHACFGLYNDISRNDWYALRIRCAPLTQTVRPRLLAAGLPLKRQFLILQGRGGSDAIGLFSEFATVLGLLEHYEQWASQYAGLRVDFTQGLYSDARFGANWWDYYFEPIRIGSSDDAVISVISPFQGDLFTFRGERLSRNRGFEIIERYIRPKPHISDKVETYVREIFQDAFVIGIHYRGTDKYQEAPVVPYERVREAVLEAIRAAMPVRYKLFLATDEQAFLDYMLAEFPGVLTYRTMFRSIDGNPTHWIDKSNHDKGEDAVIDCILLSRVNVLIRTASNLSLCSTYINSNVPEIALSREWT